MAARDLKKAGLALAVVVLSTAGLAAGAQTQWQRSTPQPGSTTIVTAQDTDPVALRLSALEAKVKTQAADIERMKTEIGIVQAGIAAPKGYTRAFATKINFNHEADNVAVFYFTPHH